MANISEPAIDLNQTDERNGSAWYMSGVPDDRWDNAKLATLGSIKGSDFQVVDATTEKVGANSYQAKTAQ